MVGSWLFHAEAFNRATDRWEHDSILDLSRAEHRDAIAALHEYKARLIASVRPTAPKNPTQPRTDLDFEDALRALGYIE